MDALSVWICIPRTHERQNSGFTQSLFGARHRSLRNENAPAWTETVTQVSYEHVRDDVYEFARRYFSEKELVDLTLAIIAINGWNRLAISFRTVPAHINGGANPGTPLRPPIRTAPQEHQRARQEASDCSSEGGLS